LTKYKTLYPVKYSNAVMPSALFHKVNNLIIYKLSSYAAIAPCLDGLLSATGGSALSTAVPSDCAINIKNKEVEIY
jgi:hypothetical protein